MEPSQLTDRELEVMHHALGINSRRRTPYRNYFVAGEDDVLVWEGLRERGFAMVTSDAYVPEPLYCITVAGLKLLGLGRCPDCREIDYLASADAVAPIMASHSAPRPTRQLCPGSGKLAQ
jgi:hypothetical protein